MGGFIRTAAGAPSMGRLFGDMAIGARYADRAIAGTDSIRFTPRKYRRVTSGILHFMKFDRTVRLPKPGREIDVCIH